MTTATIARPESAAPAQPGLDLVDCPDCGTPASVTRRAVLDSTDGPVEHVALRCGRRHVFLMPTFLLG